MELYITPDQFLAIAMSPSISLGSVPRSLGGVSWPDMQVSLGGLGVPSGLRSSDFDAQKRGAGYPAAIGGAWGRGR